MEFKLCPNCHNQLVIDKQKSLTYCKNKVCKGLIFEQSHITYEQEVNIHENEERTKATRFGGYESKKEIFISRLADQLQKLDSKGRERLEKKFEAAEHIILRISSACALFESISKEVLLEFRNLLELNIKDMEKKSFDQLALVAFCTVINQKRKNEWRNEPRMQKITNEKICDFVNMDLQKVTSLAKEIGINFESQTSRQVHFQKLNESIKNFKFNEHEIQAMKQILENLLNSSIIGGEKENTTNRYELNCYRINQSVIFLAVSQLSDNPEINCLNVEEISKKNGVTKETVKKIWNRFVTDNLIQFQKLIPEWFQRKQLNELHTIQ